MKLIDSGYDVCIVDYKEGVYKSLVNDSKVTFINYNANQPLQLDSNAIIITVAQNIGLLHKYVSNFNSLKVIYWFVHPYNLIVNFPFFKFFSKTNIKVIRFVLSFFYNSDLKILRCYLEELIQKKEVVFMDGECHRVNSQIFEFKGRPEYLPIPVSEPVTTEIACSGQSLCWLGRIEDFKTEILIRVLNDFLSSSSDKEFCVIGAGRDLDLVKGLFISSNKIKFFGSIAESEISSFLVNHVSILFAMGTSALEGAKLGIPTVLLDVFYTSVPANYHYRWLYNTKDFTLGRVIESNYQPSPDDLTFIEILVSCQQFRDEIGRKSYLYYKANHELSYVTGKLINLISFENDNITQLNYKLGVSTIFKLISRLKKMIRGNNEIE
ncbi:glycosyltransferase [Alishewanella sp. HH-ZS]|uniref:glycosyltransferase n=1 Tax=Alishewanella sp. HH-ZS TaxID=1856684 RepID=UPI0011478475|nr:glycosyltransferase [Alishewanella sp. HH-ZS]